MTSGFPLDVTTPQGRRNTILILVLINAILFVGLVFAIGITVRTTNKADAISTRFENQCAATNRARAETNHVRAMARNFQSQAALLIRGAAPTYGALWKKQAGEIPFLTTIDCRTGKETEEIAR